MILNSDKKTHILLAVSLQDMRRLARGETLYQASSGDGDLPCILECYCSDPTAAINWARFARQDPEDDE